MNSFRGNVFTIAPPEIRKCDLIRCINLKIRGIKNMKCEKDGRKYKWVTDENAQEINTLLMLTASFTELQNKNLVDEKLILSTKLA
jgi:hypothetical protein